MVLCTDKSAGAALIGISTNIGGDLLTAKNKPQKMMALMLRELRLTSCFMVMEIHDHMY